MHGQPAAKPLLIGQALSIQPSLARLSLIPQPACASPSLLPGILMSVAVCRSATGQRGAVDGVPVWAVGSV
eukprot:366399-Chlamydomonas_euryale.AAC.33